MPPPRTAAPSVTVTDDRDRLSRLRGWHWRLSLRVKGVLSLIVVVVYIGAMTAIVTQERLKLPGIVKELERVHKLEEQMVQVNLLVGRANVAASEAYFIEKGDIRTRQLFMEVTPLDAILSSVSKHYAPLASHQEQLSRLTRLLAHQPSKSVLEEIRATLQRLGQDLNQLTQGLRAEKQRLLTNYQLGHDRITLETMFFLFLGVVVVGAVMTIFFTRLTWDIRRVGLRAMAIVKGYRGAPLEITRGDEIGGLMQAINQMQSELRERERQLEMSRQQQFHHEKMAAVGSLAAAVAHEINNPIMAISGLAQVMRDQNPEGTPCPEGGLDGIPEMIIEQAKRIATITRHISEFSTPQSPEPQLVDLNSIVRNTSNFVRFDQRYRRIELEVKEDLEVGPVVAVADHITQVLINLLINAADALENVHDRKAKVTISTAHRPDVVEVIVEDNGQGMSPETLAHACDEFYTTKPRGKGSGLGLFLSKNLLLKTGATLRIESTPNSGTRIFLRFPTANVTEE